MCKDLAICLLTIVSVFSKLTSTNLSCQHEYLGLVCIMKPRALKFLRSAKFNALTCFRTNTVLCDSLQIVTSAIGGRNETTNQLVTCQLLCRGDFRKLEGSFKRSYYDDENVIKQ